MKKNILIILFSYLIIAAIAQNIIIRNPGCSSYNQNGNCKSCSTRFYMDKNYICQPVNPNCNTYNQITGDCTSCYQGFGLIEGTCLPGLDDSTIQDPNCNTFKDNVCVKCSYGYYFDPNGKCLKADPSCQTFNDLNGACTSCYSGFALSAGRCNRQIQVITDTNCNQFDSNGVCIKCSSGHYFKENICTKIDDSCREFDSIKGLCKGCYPGYSLNLGLQCIKDTIQINPNPYCSQWRQNICLSCAKGSIFNNNGICTLLDPNCKQYLTNSAVCINCYSGYTLSNGQCAKSAVQQVSDPNCNQFNSNGVCNKCSVGYYFNDLQICIKINDNCKQFSIANRKCLQCYSGYQLDSAAQCMKVVETVNDVNCAEWNGKVCIRCSLGAAFGKDGICTILDAQCKQYDSKNYLCKACYSGYQLNNVNVCVKSAIKSVRDPLCAEWSGDVCKKCATGSFFNSNRVCNQIDTSCKKSNQLTGECLGCYDGYQLDANRICVKIVQTVTDVNCAEWNGKACIRCSVGAAFNKNGICTILDAQCKLYDSKTYVCRACYAGYQLNNVNACIKSAIKAVRDSLCAQWNGDACKKCSTGSYFDYNGFCTLIDTLCKSSTITGKCLSCYDGYSLNTQSVCIKVVQNVADLNCAQWKGKVCLKCSFGAAFSNLGQCVILDSQCKQYDQLTGLCRSCYIGYQLNNLQICSKSQIQTVRDPLCAEWNKDLCTKCSPGSYFGSKGVCQQIDPSCKAANPLNGACMGCYDGYKLSTLGTCVKFVEEVADINCAQWNGKLCIKCSIGAAFNSLGRCTILDAQCKQYDSKTNFCKACYQGYQLSDSKICIKSAIQNVKDSLCSEWNNEICIKCSSGSYFNKDGVCTQVDPQCSSFNKMTGQCLGCYPGYTLSQANLCVKAAVENDNNSLCAEWKEWEKKVCLRCSQNSFFNGLGVCELVDPLCRTSNIFNGACTSCFDGFIVSGSKCVVGKQADRDPLCSEFAGLICIKCSFGAYFNSKGACQLADSLCQSFNRLNGACISCYPGHILIDGICAVDRNNQINDPFCAQFKDKICTKCSSGYYFERDGKCTAVDPLCATFNSLNGICLSCFDGYQLSSGLCIKAKQIQKDPNCAVFQNSQCKECSKGFIFNQINKSNLCVLVNPLCKTYHAVSGACLTCYNGYAISGNTCVVDKTLTSSNCAQYIDGICIRCSERSFMNSNGQCEKISDDCRTYNDFSGQCLSCYSGFIVNQGRCVKDEVKGGCSQLDKDGNCVKCAVGFYINIGRCSQIDPQCAKFNLGSNRCQGCYNGYTFLQGRCEISKVNQQFQVKNCVAYNTDNKCIQCFDRFYLTNNQCKEVNVFCKTYDLVSGKCTGCYSTFSLINGECKH